MKAEVFPRKHSCPTLRTTQCNTDSVPGIQCVSQGFEGAAL